jgi:hypothetical protein
VIHRSDFVRIVRELFPMKGESSMTVIHKALFMDAPGVFISYPEVFAEDAEGNQGHFCEALRDQYVDEISQYQEEIDASVRSALLDDNR